MSTLQQSSHLQSEHPDKENCKAVMHLLNLPHVHRVPESLRWEGTSGDHLVQPPVQRKVSLSMVLSTVYS